MNSKYQLTLSKEGLNLKGFKIENSKQIQDYYREQNSEVGVEVYSLKDIEQALKKHGYE